MQLRGIEIVVFDGVAGFKHLRILQARDMVERIDLGLLGKGGGEAIEIIFVGVSALRFQKELVPFLVGEAVEFVFDGWAIAGADALDPSLEHGRILEVGAEDFMHLGIGVGDEAGKLFCEGRGGGEGEASGDVVSRLRGHAVEVDGASIDADGGAGFEFIGADAEVAELVGEQGGGGFAEATSGEVDLSDVYSAVEEGAGGEDDFTGAKGLALLGDDASRVVIFHEDGGDEVLSEVEVGLVFEQLFPEEGELLFVALGSGAPHGRSFGTVEHTELDHGVVGDDAGHSAQGVDLADDLSFGDAADSGIARHLRDEV